MGRTAVLVAGLGFDTRDLKEAKILRDGLHA